MANLKAKTAGRGPRPWLAVVAAGEAATFLLGAVAHLGVRIPLVFARIEEPRIAPATMVEGLCGLALAGSAAAIATEQPRARTAAFAAQGVALAGVLLGMAALAAGRGPRTPLNDAYHRIMLAALLAGLAWLCTPSATAIFTRSPATEAADIGA